VTWWWRAWRRWVLPEEERAGDPVGITKAEALAVFAVVLWGVAYFLTAVQGLGCASLCRLVR